MDIHLDYNQIYIIFTHIFRVYRFQQTTLWYKLLIINKNSTQFLLSLVISNIILYTYSYLYIVDMWIIISIGTDIFWFENLNTFRFVYVWNSYWIYWISVEEFFLLFFIYSWVAKVIKKKDWSSVLLLFKKIKINMRHVP